MLNLDLILQLFQQKKKILYNKPLEYGVKARLLRHGTLSQKSG